MLSERLLPPLLQQRADFVKQQLMVALKQQLPMNEPDDVALALSDFVSEYLIKYPQWWQALKQQPPTTDEYQHYSHWLAEKLQLVNDEASLMRCLRLFRCHMLVRISWGQSLQLYSTEESLHLLSELAETLILAARNWVYQQACCDWGTPTNTEGDAQPLIVLAMGKLGGKELNYSSDVDLIFIYPESGLTKGSTNHWDNAYFFTRVGQRLIKVLDSITVEGFVYRVDMRLRPFGESGPLVLNFNAFAEYYQQQGRDWERYAMIKARVLSDSHQKYDNIVQQMLKSFIFRRYVDFTVIQSLRTMKGMIVKDIGRRGVNDNIKLSAGGIRDIEFIIQIIQLIHGGREPSLQGSSSLETLAEISQLELLGQYQIKILRRSYLFLRRLENMLQAISDQQIHTLPRNKLDQARVAWGMKCADWEEFYIKLKGYMRDVKEIFDHLIGENKIQEQDEGQLNNYTSLWLNDENTEKLNGLMPALDMASKRMALTAITHFRRDLAKRGISQRGKEVLDKLMPRLLAEVCIRDDVTQLLPCLISLLLSIATRTTYLDLLLEYRSALTQLIRLCAASPMLADKLASYPVLLSELLDPRVLYQPTALDAYKNELCQYLLRIPEEDEEQQLDALRQFKQIQLLRIAAADINDTLPIMKVSDHLTYLAEAIIEVVVQQAWRYTSLRYGEPTHLAKRDGRGFAVIAYGKLGGWELGYSSDLDLVFLIDCPEQVMTNGEQSISGSQFYMRLAQRIIHLFSTRTVSGILYQIDARLRPSGSSGLLVSTINAFVNYQRTSAWTWEHQALVRARIVYQDIELATAFTDVRHEILSRVRDEQALRQEVCQMRKKITQQHLHNINEKFDLKYDPGGIVDIEFIAQYLVLNHAHQQPKLTYWSDNVRIFELMTEYGIISSSDGAALAQTYISMRDELHRLTLAGGGNYGSALAFSHRREFVKGCWEKWLSETR